MIQQTILFIGNAPLELTLLTACYQDLRRAGAPVLVVAADGGVRHAQAVGIKVDVVIGDFDSGGREGLAHQHWHMPDQTQTDFAKALTHFSKESPAARWCALGFSGGRLDHSVAVLAELAQWAGRDRLLLVDSFQVTRVCVGSVSLPTTAEGVIGVLPLAPIRFARSRGLRWSLEGLDLAPTGLVSVSNQATADAIALTPAQGYEDAAYVVTAPTALWARWWGP